MKEFNYKSKSKGFGDTIAKITHATGLDKVADKVAKMAGKEDCGCGRRKDILNEIFPYTTDNGVVTGSVVNTEPLNKIEGNYLVLRDIHCTLPEIGEFIFQVGTELPITIEHPLYNDIQHYYKNNIIKKL
tara:strand:+ start:430 stop:819 length:390 start_codon:yes stop_codon:yes gene_type:complete